MPKKWDVFISHASEDKVSVAQPIAEQLKRLGLKVWLDKFELQIGDSLMKSIDEGLKHSEFGLVVLSKAFAEKKWTDYELRSLTTLAMANASSILPVRHNISQDEVINISPALADLFALNTEDFSSEEIAFRVARKVKPETFQGIIRRLEFERRIKSIEPSDVDVSAIKMGPIIQERIPEGLALQMKLSWIVLSEINPVSFGEWVDGFKRDAHPSDEVKIWNRIACAFLETKKTSKKWSKKKALAVFSVILHNANFGGSAPIEISAPPLSGKEIYDIGIRYRTPFPLSDLAVLNRNEVSDIGRKRRNDLMSVEDLDAEISEETLNALRRHLGIG